MKKLISLFALVATVISANAAPTETFAGAGSGAATLSFGLHFSPGRLPRLNYINATSDKAASVIKFYTMSAPLLITAAVTDTNINITVAHGTAFAQNDIVVIRNASTGALTRTTVSSVTTSNIVTAANVTIPAGSQIWEATAAGLIPVGAASKELNAGAGAIYNGEVGKPFLFEIDGTSACKINAYSGWFER